MRLFLDLIVINLLFIGACAPEQPVSKAVEEIARETKPLKPDEKVNNLTTAPILVTGYKFTKDDKLDLHHVRLKAVKNAILNFLAQAKELNKNYVLIITGKGIHSTEKYALSDGTEVGAIKFHVLRWLQEGTFSDFIKDYSYANVAHGGEGALYIEIKP